VDVVRLSPGVLRPVAVGSCFNDCVLGELTVAGQTVHLLAPDRLLLAGERARLAQLQAAQEERLRRLEEARP
jgi:hypothetical protein